MPSGISGCALQNSGYGRELIGRANAEPSRCMIRAARRPNRKLSVTCDRSATGRVVAIKAPLTLKFVTRPVRP
jgi:hypothetical protein